MLTWLILIAVSILLGVAVSYIPGKWSWLLIIPIPLFIIFLLNYHYDRLPTTEPGVSMSELAYIFAGVPSITIALIIWCLMRYYRRQE